MNNNIYLPVALLVTIATPLSLADSSTHSGEGTFYGYGGGGNCSFPKNNNILTAAMNATDYAGSAACGGVIVVTNDDTGLSVTVRIDDQCPECAKGDVDLDQNAFAQIADISKGRIPISWHYVANDQAGNMKLYFKEGSSQWWTAVQVRDHLYPIAKLGYRITGSGSGFIDLPRQPYNYFLASGGFGVGPYDFRITDFWGQTVEVSGISLVVSSEIDTGTQFPLYGSVNDYPANEPVNEPVNEPESEPEYPPSDNTEGSTNPALTSLSTITSWSSGYCANVDVTNPNNSSLTWSINLDVGGYITSLWNADWSQNGTILTASGVSWNATLVAGGSTRFGFCVNY
jgi:expansin (peptidoglycan-binding protein)